MNDTMEAGAPPASFSHASMLDILARADAEGIKAAAEDLLDELGPVEVLLNRTGLAMLPYIDTVQNTAFHLGEVLETLRGEPETLLARMSGSGATCFALCAGDIEAEGLAERLESMRPDWWVRRCRLG